MMKSGVIKNWQYAILVLGVALGVTVCLTGAFLMWDGSILGENHAGIATIVGITGIGLIGTSGAVLAGALAGASSEKTQ